jgi:hypothetical protein
MMMAREPRRAIPEDEVSSLGEVEARVPEGTRLQSVGYDRVIVIEPEVAPYTLRLTNG